MFIKTYKKNVCTLREHRLIFQEAPNPFEQFESQLEGTQPKLDSALKELLDKKIGNNDVRDYLKRYTTGEIADRIRGNKEQFEKLKGVIGSILQNYEELKGGKTFNAGAETSEIEKKIIADLQALSSFEELVKLAQEIGVLEKPKEQTDAGTDEEKALNAMKNFEGDDSIRPGEQRYEALMKIMSQSLKLDRIASGTHSMNVKTDSGGYVVTLDVRGGYSVTTQSGKDVYAQTLGRVTFDTEGKVLQKQQFGSAFEAQKLTGEQESQPLSHLSSTEQQYLKNAEKNGYKIIRSPRGGARSNINTAIITPDGETIYVDHSMYDRMGHDRRVLATVKAYIEIKDRRKDEKLVATEDYVVRNMSGEHVDIDDKGIVRIDGKYVAISKENPNSVLVFGRDSNVVTMWKQEPLLYIKIEDDDKTSAMYVINLKETDENDNFILQEYK